MAKKLYKSTILPEGKRKPQGEVRGARLAVTVPLAVGDTRGDCQRPIDFRSKKK